MSKEFIASYLYYIIDDLERESARTGNYHLSKPIDRLYALANELEEDEDDDF